VMAYSVAQRTQEIGIRMALGASASVVVRWVLWHGIKLSLLGIAIGIGGGLAGTRLISTLLYRVPPTDAPTFLCVSILLIGTAAAACLLPAWRASRTDPARTLGSSQL